MVSNKVAAGRMRRVCRAGLLWVCLLGLAVSCRSGQQGQALVPGTPAYRYDRLYQEARSAQQEQRYEAAIRLFRQCLAWPEGPADSLEALDYQASVTGTLQQLMNTYQSAGRPDAGAACFDSLLAAPPVVVKDYFYADLLSVAGYALSRTERMQEAERCTDRALATPLWNPTPNRLFRTYAYAAAVFFPNPDRQEQVIELAEKGMSVARWSENVTGVQYISSMLGTLYKRTGRMEESITMLEQSLQMSHECKDRLGEVNACYALTDLLLYWGLVNQANVIASRGIRIIDDIERHEDSVNPMVFGCMFLMKGRVMEQLDLQDSALYYWTKSEVYTSRLPYNSGMADVDVQLGRKLCQMAAEDSVQMGVRHLERVIAEGTLQNKATAYYHLARLYLGRGQEVRGEACLDSMYNLLHRSPAPVYIKGAYAFGLTYYLKKDWKEGIYRYAGNLIAEQQFTKDEQKITDALVRMHVNVRETRLQLLEEQLHNRTLVFTIISLVVLLGGIIVVIVVINQRSISHTRQRLAESKLEGLMNDHRMALQMLEEQYRYSSHIQQQLDQVLNDRRQRSELQASSLAQAVAEGGMEHFYVRFDMLYPLFRSNLKRRLGTVGRREEFFCMLILMGQNGEQIADLMAVAPRSVNMMRYRLRKKLWLAPEDSFEDTIKALAE